MCFLSDLTSALNEFVEKERNGFRDGQSKSLTEWLKNNPEKISIIAEELAFKYEQVQIFWSVVGSGYSLFMHTLINP